jgi:hypothetical protein
LKLPNGHHANLGRKLEDYVLNPLHREGQHKARVFQSVLGITLANAEVLRDALKAVATNSDEATASGDNGYGDCYVLHLRLSTTKGAATLVSGWIVKHGEDFPRLTTCYIIEVG